MEQSKNKRHVSNCSHILIGLLDYDDGNDRPSVYKFIVGGHVHYIIEREIYYVNLK